MISSSIIVFNPDSLLIPSSIYTSYILVFLIIIQRMYYFGK